MIKTASGFLRPENIACMSADSESLRESADREPSSLARAESGVKGVGHSLKGAGDTSRATLLKDALLQGRSTRSGDLAREG